ncbi:MAG: lipid A deacylase LpxR family protein [Verrucomicrobia bacterium]|nr:MAG: lipid A deacylase LpxR family protein [Verrucomicrobiota bacterium]
MRGSVALRHLERWSRWLGLGLSVAGGLVVSAQPAFSPDLRGPTLELAEENDWFAGTDRHYTQGFRAVYLGAERSPSHGIKGFAAYGLRADTWRWGFEIGQSIFTPGDLTVKYLLPDDRPYAGWLYAGPVLQRRGVLPGSGLPVLENIQLQVGVVGPGALAKEEQNTAHFAGGFAQAAGWHNQLGNEPGCALKYQRTWRWSPSQSRDWNIELLPHTGASLGNVDTSARMGATFRAGWRLPDDFGIQTIDSLGVTDGGRTSGASAQRPGFYIFGRVEERAVARNEFLDGSLFRQNSPYVDRRPLVCELQGGAVWVMARLDLVFMMVYRTKEFEGQSCEDAFGALAAHIKF